MSLIDVSPDQILEKLMEWQNAHIAAAEAEALAEAAHRAMEGAVYKALRSAGESVKDSEMGVKSSDAVLESLKDLIQLQTKTMKAKAGVERAKLRSELYRTIRADSRRI